MTFLSPAPALLAAAIAIPALLALYFLKLRRRPIRVSSTLLWEQAVQDLQANVPLRWLRASWILLIQLLALLCLLIALARPAIPTSIPRADRTIIILDRSATMSAADGVPSRGLALSLPSTASDNDSPRRFTRFDEAKASARRIITELSSAAQRAPMMLVTLDHRAEALTPFTTDPRDLTDALDSVTPSDQPGNLRAALDLAQALTANLDTGAEIVPRVNILLITDGGLVSPPQSFTASQPLPPSISLQLVHVGPNGADSGLRTQGSELPNVDAGRLIPNVGIVALSARRDADDPALARIFVRVINSGPAPISTTLTCRVDDQPVGLAAVELPAASMNADVQIEPGEATATFEVSRPDQALIVVALAYAPSDRLDADNTAACLLEPARKPRILVVGPDDDAADTHRAARGAGNIDRFLLGVLEDLAPTTLQLTIQASYNAAPAQGFDLIIFDRATPSAVPKVPTLSIAAGVPALNIAIAPATPIDPPTRISLWDREHPILRSAPLDSIYIAQPLRIDMPEKLAAYSPRTLARSAVSPLIVLLEPRTLTDPRRLFIAFDLLQTNWGPDVTFPIFVSDAIDHLTARATATAARSLTTTSPLFLTRLDPALPITITGPTPTNTVTIPANDQPRIEHPPLDRAGVYALTNTTDTRLAVNLADQHSSLCQSRALIPISRGQSLSTVLPGTHSPVREIWPYFALASLPLLALEFLLFARTMRA